MSLLTFRLGGFVLMVSLGLSLENCSPKRNLAPDRNFYFEVITHDDGEFSTGLSTYLNSRIPKKKYTITNHSGLTWPFYKELDLDEHIVKDSLMPPHWYLHKMIPFSKGQQLKRDEFLVKIDLLPKL